MNKSVNKVILGSSTLLAMGATAVQAQAATTSVNINAEVLAAVEITAVNALNFGIVDDNGGAGGIAVVDTAGTFTGASTVASLGGTIQAGSFTVKGATGRNIDITTPASVVINDGGPNNMTVNSFSLLAPAGGGGASNTGTAAAGAAIVASLTAATVTGFTLGATLNVGAAQVAGTYTGSVTVTALYQ